MRVLHRLGSERLAGSPAVVEQVGVELLDLERRQCLQLVSTEVLLEPLPGNDVRMMTTRPETRLLARQPVVEEVAQPRYLS